MGENGRFNWVEVDGQKAQKSTVMGLSGRYTIADSPKNENEPSPLTVHFYPLGPSSGRRPLSLPNW